MKSYYVQKADQIFPIFGANNMEEAKQFVEKSDHHRIVETDESVLMNPCTGSVDFESEWKDVDSAELIEVEYDINKEQWAESE